MGMKARGGTGSQGLKSRSKTHIVCRRCGLRTFHKSKKKCASCGYGNSPKKRNRHIGH